MAFPTPAEPRRVLHPEIEAYASGWMVRADNVLESTVQVFG